MIPARGKGIAKTDLSIAIPHGTYARIAPRSGLAAKHFIDTGAGVVDEDYRGNVGVVLFNHSDQDFQSKNLAISSIFSFQTMNADCNTDLYTISFGGSRSSLISGEQSQSAISLCQFCLHD